MSGKTNPISALGGWIRGQISGIGYFTRFFLGLLGAAASRSRARAWYRSRSTSSAITRC